MNDEVLTQFVSLTGCDRHVADNYLAAHDYDLERSVDFFFEHPPEARGVPDVDAGRATLPPGLPAHHGGSPPPLPAAYADDELEQALEASREAGVHPAPRAESIEIMSDDEEQGEGLAVLAQQQRARALAVQRAAHAQMDAMHGVMAAADELFRQAGVPGPRDMTRVTGSALHDRPRSFPLGAEPAGPSFSTDPDAPPRLHEPLRPFGLAATAAAAAAAAAGAAAQGPTSGGDGSGAPLGGTPMAVHDDFDADLQLPDGINIEEARMLEAAMLGIPYAGRMPDFANQPPPFPVDPAMRHQRMLREEQDAAYEESLALDRLKQEEEARKREEEQQLALALQREEEERRAAAARAEADAADAKRRLQQLLADKAAALPPQPEAGRPGSVMVLVRLPDGSRQGRRFLVGDSMGRVFDFVDVQAKGAPKPGGYRLVTQFPRQVFEHAQDSSLVDCGITSDTSFFVEVL